MSPINISKMSTTHFMEKEIRTIILPGYSLYNRVWAHEIAHALSKNDLKVFVHEWMHWKRGSFIAEREVKRVLDDVNNVKVNILAKSVGIRIAVELVKAKPDILHRVILCGIPFRGMYEGAKKNITEGFTNMDPQKIIIFQNTQDPFGSYKLIRDFVWEINPQISVVEMPRKDHNYPYPIDFSDFLLSDS